MIYTRCLSNCTQMHKSTSKLASLCIAVHIPQGKNNLYFPPMLPVPPKPPPTPPPFEPDDDVAPPADALFGVVPPVIVDDIPRLFTTWVVSRTTLMSGPPREEMVGDAARRAFLSCPSTRGRCARILGSIGSTASAQCCSHCSLVVWVSRGFHEERRGYFSGEGRKSERFSQAILVFSLR